MTPCHFHSISVDVAVTPSFLAIYAHFNQNYNAIVCGQVHKMYPRDYLRLSWTIMDCHGLSWTVMDYHGVEIALYREARL